MKTLACRDLGMDCPFSASGETAEEVKAKLMTHAQEVHADMLANLSDEEKAGMSQIMDEKMAAA